jgi:rRNA maturation endonuclease Nob1
MDDEEERKFIIEMYLETENLNDIESKEQLINCIPSKHKLQGNLQNNKKKKININKCNKCNENSWKTLSKENEKVCKRCGHQENILGFAKKEWLPNRGFIPDFVPVANKTFDGRRLNAEQLERQKAQKRINRQLNPKNKQKSEVPNINQEMGVQLKQIYADNIPEKLVVDLKNVYIEMNEIVKAKNITLPRGIKRKSMNVLLIWYLSDGNLQKILTIYTDVTKKNLVDGQILINWMVNMSNNISHLRNMKIKLLNDENVICYEELRDILKELRKEIKKRFENLSDSEIHVISVGLYIFKTPEGKELKKNNTFDKVIKDCGVQKINKKYNEVFKWFKSEKIWDLIN